MTNLRRSTAILLAVALVAAACDAPPPPPADPAAAVDAAADAYLAAFTTAFPEQATPLDLPGTDHGRLRDNSLAGVARWHAQVDSMLAALDGIDTTGLGARPQAVTYGVMRSLLARGRSERVCRNELWAVASYVNGWQAELTDVALVQPVGSDSLRAKAIERARAIPAFIDTEIANAREGLRQGYSSPKRIVEAVIRQVDDLLATTPEASPFSAPARRDSTPAFAASLHAIVADSIAPALRRYRDFLAGEYLPAAREALGVSANPDGRACYEAELFAFSTIRIPADSVFATGERELARIAGEMREIGRRLFGTDDAGAAIRRATTDPAYRFRSSDELLAYAQAAMDRAAAASPQAFGITTDAKVVLTPYPEFRARAGAPGQYQMPPEDGSRPASYLINTWQADRQSRGSVEATTFHEAWPGHHQQLMAARQATGMHRLTRTFFNSGFGEGWALYAERVADEQGLYSGDIDRLGYLASQAYRAVRMVVDAGIHTRGMSYEEAATLMETYTTNSPAKVVGEVNRYISWPGQAPSYMIGNLVILALREEARGTMGDRFDIRAFHDRVLERGNVTLPMLQAHVNAWMRANP